MSSALSASHAAHCFGDPIVGDVLPVTRVADDAAFGEDYAATNDGVLREDLQRAAVERRPPLLRGDELEVSRVERASAVRLDDSEVGVGADLDRPLLWVQAEDLRRRRR